MGAASLHPSQRAYKDALAKIDPAQIYHTFPDRREGSKSSLILKRTKTQKSNRVLYMTKPLKEELLAWLKKLKQDEQSAPEKYSNCGQLFRLPDGLPIAPDVLTKWYGQWRGEHPEFEKIVFHGLRHSSATYQLLQSGGTSRVQGNIYTVRGQLFRFLFQANPELSWLRTSRPTSTGTTYPVLPPANRRNKKAGGTNITGPVILGSPADESRSRRELVRLLFA